MLFLLFSCALLFSSGSTAPAVKKEVVPPNGTCLYDGLTMAELGSDSAYFVCCARIWLIKYCAQGEVFDKFNLTCVPSANPPSSCPFGAMRPSPNGDPRAFLICDGHEWVLEYCLQGLVYNPNTQTCVPEYSTERPSTPQPSTKRPTTENRPFYDGPCQESAGADGFRPNPADCRTYFQCVHSQWMLRDCGPGTQWRQSILGCDYFYGVCSFS
ncbi:unnamed protein product [Caenorhabditis sp. 36 PRJEB53466]|nr:unnamed protein product [Caenorhabditis sp. 36 PRJEB53466]